MYNFRASQTKPILYRLQIRVQEFAGRLRRRGRLEPFAREDGALPADCAGGGPRSRSALERVAASDIEPEARGVGGSARRGGGGRAAVERVAPAEAHAKVVAREEFTEAFFFP